ncbi:retropepsin-like aspartic protease family protein [Halomonas halocynthiae]|uniref:retropepsin-like aspartic protease family protein n=1 Tax=Halomonas halocynthiae TaxID=176290 RepID=UPI0003F84A19|nr:retropepsin-like aspartic protease [Halomonas halocynthiae]
MMLAFWVLLFGLGIWWFSGLIDARQNPNANLLDAPPGTSVTLERNASGHYVVSGRINGEPVVMLLDTGATSVAVPEPLAKQLGLPHEGEAWFTTANGRVRGQLTMLDEISVGGITAQQVRGSISSGLSDDMVLLGMSFLGRFDIEIRDKQMVLRVPDTRP